MRIKVMADYDCHPLWWDGPDRVGDIDPSGLGLSSDLSAALADWAARYDAILNRSDPTRSAFASATAELAFEERGRRLAERVGAELGSRARVRYWRDDEDRLRSWLSPTTTSL